MALAPSGSALLLGNSEGGIRRFQLDTRGETPRVIEVTGGGWVPRCGLPTYGLVSCCALAAGRTTLWYASHIETLHEPIMLASYHHVVQYPCNR